MKTKITGMGMYLPEQTYTSEEIEERAGFTRLGLKKGLVRMLTGCESRHYSAPDEMCSDLAAKAGAAAIKDAGMEVSDIDALIFGAITRDYSEPATANRAAHLLGMKDCFTFDIFNACNAFISGIDLADSLIRTGKAKNVLVVCGEALSKWTKFDYTDKDELLMRAPVALSVGDGGGAFVISAAEDDDPSGIVSTYFRSLPQFWEVGVIWGGGVIHKEESMLFVPGTVNKLTQAHADMTKAYFPPSIEKAGWKVEDIDCFLMTQIADWILKNIKKTVGGRDDQFISVIKNIGNCGACNIPLTACIARDMGKIKKGDKLCLMVGAAGASLGTINVVL